MITESFRSMEQSINDITIRGTPGDDTGKDRCEASTYATYNCDSSATVSRTMSSSCSCSSSMCSIVDKIFTYTGCPTIEFSLCFACFSRLPVLIQRFILPFFNSPGDEDSKTHLTFHPMSKIDQVTEQNVRQPWFRYNVDKPCMYQKNNI